MKGHPNIFIDSVLLLIFHVGSSKSALKLLKNESSATELYQLPKEPTYFILSSEALELDNDYQVIVSLFKTNRGSATSSFSVPSFPHTVRAQIWRDGSIIASQIIDCYEGMTQTMNIKVSDHSLAQKEYEFPPKFKLVVEGHRDGRIDGILFREERPLMLKKPDIWIYVETERPIYTPGQTVSAKVIPFETSNQRPWTSGSIDASLKNPLGEIVAKWKDKRLILSKLKQGKDDYVILLNYELADITSLGEWTFELSSHGYTNASKTMLKSFWVEEYFPQDIEVRVWLPPTVIPGDKFVNGWISANKVVGGASVPGTLKLYAILKNNDTATNSFRIPVNFKFEGKSIFLTSNSGYSELESFSGFVEFRFSSNEIKRIRLSTKSNFHHNSHILMTLEAQHLPDTKFAKSIRSEDLSYSFQKGSSNQDSIIGYATTRLLPKNLEMKILTPPNSLPYRPDLPYIAWVRVVRSDGSDLTLKDLEQGIMTVESFLVFHNKTRFKLSPIPLRRQHKFFTPGSQPLWKLSYSLRHVLPPEMEAISPTELYGSLLMFTELKVKYVTRDMKVEKKIKLVPDRGLAMDKQRQRIIQQGLRVSASPMVPMIGDNIIFHVHSNFFLEGFQVAIISSSRNIIETRYIMMGQSSLKTFHQIATEAMAPESTLIIWVVTPEGNLVSAATRFTVDASASTSSIKINTEPVITSGFGGYTEVKIQAASNTRYKTFISFHALDIYLRARSPQTSFPKPDLIHGAQLSGDFKSHGLIVMTDAELGPTIDYKSSNTTSVSPVELNGFVQFENEFDVSKVIKYPRASPVSSELKGNGFWKTVVIYPGKNLTLKIPFAGNGGKLILAPVAFSRNTGYFLHQELTVSIGNPFHVTLEVPEYCRYGEILSGRLTFINKHNHVVFKHVRIYKSIEFTFVDLEGNTQGDSLKKFSLHIPANSFRTFQIPFRPSKSGKITIQVQIDNSHHLLSESIYVLEEGISKHFHESHSIDLVNHRYFIDDLNPPSMGNKELTVSGGLHGPLLSYLPLNSSSMILNLPMMSADEAIFAILLTLLHKEERSNYVISLPYKKIKNNLQISLQRLLSYRTRNNAFTFTRGRSGSPCLWITALALRALHKLSIDSIGIFVDPSIPLDIQLWLIKQQRNDGSFSESYLYPNIKDHFIPLEMQETALTAHVLLVLAELKDDASSAQTIFTIDRALHYLTSKLGELDIYGSTLVVALVSRALQVARASGAEAAFEILAKRRKETSEGFHWDSGKENNLLKSRDCDDLLDVRTTALALLVYTERGEFMTESIIRWLNSKRKFFSGWSSTIDTAYVIEAFNLWTSRHTHHIRKTMSRQQPQANQLQKNDNVVVEIQSQESLNSDPSESLRIIVEEGMSRKVLLNSKIGSSSIRVEGNGRGLALVQLHSVTKTTTLGENVIYKVSNNSGAKLDLDVQADPNNDVSEIRFRSCHRWFCLSDQRVSGPVVLQIQLPTGFKIIRNDLLEALRQIKTEEIIEKHNQISIFFSKV
uniref:Macroglobulin complementrelated CG7586PAlike [Tribolium castaneum] n=1 Tax=Lepeophtheirus salmonis TaxID=72036 RepID=A0A0K2TMG2_LEPSM